MLLISFLAVFVYDHHQMSLKDFFYAFFFDLYVYVYELAGNAHKCTDGNVLDPITHHTNILQSWEKAGVRWSPAGSPEPRQVARLVGALRSQRGELPSQAELGAFVAEVMPHTHHHLTYIHKPVGRWRVFLIWQ